MAWASLADVALPWVHDEEATPCRFDLGQVGNDSVLGGASSERVREVDLYTVSFRAPADPMTLAQTRKRPILPYPPIANPHEPAPADHGHDIPRHASSLIGSTARARDRRAR